MTTLIVPRLVLSVTLVLTLFVSVANARIVTVQAPCTGDGDLMDEWSVTLTLDENGRVLYEEGTFCDGMHYFKDWRSTVKPVVEFDFDSQVSTHVFNYGNYWVRLNVDPANKITKVWGIDANGIKWVCESTGGPFIN